MVIQAVTLAAMIYFPFHRESTGKNMACSYELPYLSEVPSNSHSSDYDSNTISRSSNSSCSWSTRELTTRFSHLNISSSASPVSSRSQHTSQESILDIIASYNNPYQSFNINPSFQSENESRFPRCSVMGPDGKTTNSARSPYLKSKHNYTRQINIFIGEEWENVRESPQLRDKASSCPPSPTGRRLQGHPQSLRDGTTDTTCPLQPELMQIRRAQHLEDPLNYFFLHLSRDEQKTNKDYMIKPNPYNEFNHVIHSILHCPCFFFFCFICCLPGIHLMQKSDIDYRRGNFEPAKTYSRRSTVLYVTGIIFGVAFLVCTVFVSVSFVQHQ